MTKAIKNKISNYSKPTVGKWRLVNEFLLNMIPVVQMTLIGAPASVFSINQKFWIGSVCTIILGGLRSLIKLMTDKNEISPAGTTGTPA